MLLRVETLLQAPEKTTHLSFREPIDFPTDLGRLTRPLEGDVAITRTDDDRYLQIHGTFNTEAELVCDRCLGPVPTALSVDVDEMLEVARVDGASEGQIFRRIVLPSLQPIVVTLGLFVFLGSWNDFLWPLIILTDQSNYTLPVALAALSREHVQDIEMMMAGAVITVAPVLILFLALQRYYIRGMLAGSVKG